MMICKRSGASRKGSCLALPERCHQVDDDSNHDEDDEDHKDNGEDDHVFFVPY